MINTIDPFVNARFNDRIPPNRDATDSFDMMPVLLGSGWTLPVRPHLPTQSFRGEFQIRKVLKYSSDHRGSGGNNYERPPLKQYALVETAPDAPGQLHDLDRDRVKQQISTTPTPRKQPRYKTC